MRHRRQRSSSISPIMITPFRSARLRSVNRPALLSLTGAGLFLASLDAYVVVTPLLPMLTSVHIAVNRAEQATPIITGFLLGYLAVMPIAGGLSDRFGRIRVFAACLVLFAFGSLLTASAPSLSQLVTGRLLQGAGGGALVPAVLALAADLYPAGDRSPVLGAVSALQEIGSVLGPLWGGLVTASSFGWTWIFWLNIPAAALIIWALWPEIRSRREDRRPTGLDWIGALLATAGLALLTLALYAADPEQSPVGAGFIWQAPLAILCFWLVRSAHVASLDRRALVSGFVVQWVGAHERDRGCRPDGRPRLYPGAGQCGFLDECQRVGAAPGAADAGDSHRGLARWLARAPAAELSNRRRAGSRPGGGRIPPVVGLDRGITQAAPDRASYAGGRRAVPYRAGARPRDRTGQRRAARCRRGSGARRGGIVSDRHAIGRDVGRLLAGRGIRPLGVSPRHRAFAAAVARAESKLRGPVRLLHAEGQASDFRRIPPDLPGHPDRAAGRCGGGRGDLAAAGSTSLAIAGLF